MAPRVEKKASRAPGRSGRLVGAHAPFCVALPPRAPEHASGRRCPLARGAAQLLAAAGWGEASMCVRMRVLGR